MTGFSRFTKLWASLGTILEPSDAQANAGYAFLGQAPPSVELFNAQFQDLDYKDNTLFNWISSFLTSQGMTAADASPDQLRDALLTLTFAQGPSAIGSVRNARMIVAAASATATFTADEIVVAVALGGRSYRLGSFNHAVNLGTVGAGGMDTGTAPLSGYVALYAIYNPTAATAALLAVNATSGVAPEVYGGANMPAGYTASALVSVWPTNGSRLFIVGNQIDRRVSMPQVSAVSTGTAVPTLTSLSLAAIVPPNAKSVSGGIGVVMNAGSGTSQVTAACDSIGTGNYTGTCSGQTQQNQGGSTFSNLSLPTSQTIWWDASIISGTATFANGQVVINGYEF